MNLVEVIARTYSELKDNASLISLIVGVGIYFISLFKVAEPDDAEIDRLLNISIAVLEKLSIETSSKNIKFMAEMVLAKRYINYRQRQKSKEKIIKAIKSLRDIDEMKAELDFQNLQRQIKIDDYLDIDELFFKLYAKETSAKETSAKDKQKCVLILSFGKGLIINYNTEERYQQALACFELVQESDFKLPEIEDSDINRWIDSACLLLGYPQDSLNNFKPNTESNLKTYSDFDTAGLFSRRAGRMKEALQFFDRGLKLKPNDRYLLEHKAVTLILMGDKQSLGQAITTFNQIPCNCQDGQYFTNLAIAYRQLKKFDKAIEAHKKAIKCNPKDINNIYSFAITYWCWGKWSNAIKWCNEIIKIDQKNGNSHYLKACCHALRTNNFGTFFGIFQRNESGEAIDSLEKAIYLDLNFKQEAKNELDFKNIEGHVNFRKLVFS